MFWQYIRAAPEKTSRAGPGFLRLGASVCSGAIGLCGAIILARALGPASFGVYACVLWLATVAVPAIGIGSSALTGRHVAAIQGQQSPRMVAGVFRFAWNQQSRNVVRYCLGLLVLALPLAWCFGANVPALWLLFAGLTALPMLFGSVVNTTLRSLRRFDLLALLHLFGVAVSLVLVLLAAHARSERLGVFLLASALASTATLAVGLLALVRILPMREALQPSMWLKDRLTRGVNHSLLLFLLDCIVWQRSELLLLARRSGAAQLGFYALASIISTHIMEFAPALFSTCLLPLLLRYVPGQRYVSASDAFVKNSRLVALIALPLCGIGIVLAPALLTACLGVAFLPVVGPLRILLVAAASGSISTVALTHLAQGDRRKAQLRLGAAAALINVALAIPFVLAWDITGAALASAVAQIVSALGSILICRTYMLSTGEAALVVDMGKVVDAANRETGKDTSW